MGLLNGGGGGGVALRANKGCYAEDGAVRVTSCVVVTRKR